MKNNDICEFEPDELDDLRKVCPWAYRKVVDWEHINSTDVLFELDDNSVILLDTMMKTYRCAKSRKDLYLMTHPKEEEKWICEFSYNLNRLMVKNGITQSELSMASGISQCTISSYLNCKRFPTAFNVVKIMRALNCSDDEIVKLICVH